MYKKITSLLIVGLSLFTLSCKPETTNQYMGKNQFSGPPPDNRLMWSYAFDGAITTTPVMSEFWTPIKNSEGKETKMKKNELFMIIGTSKGELHSFDYRNGVVKWTNKYNVPITTTPSVLENNVLFGVEDGYFYSVDSFTGKENWKFMVSGIISTDSFVNDNVVYFGTQDGVLYALDIKTGKEIWKKELQNTIKSTPVVYNDFVYTSSEDGNFYAINKASGETKWSFKTNGKIQSSPIAVNGKVYIISDDKNLYSLDSESGAPTWTTNLNGITKSTPSINLNKNRIYVAVGKSLLYIDLKTGQIVKETILDEEIEKPVINLDGFIYVTDKKGRVYHIDETNQTVKWRFQGEGENSTAPYLFNGIVHYGTDEGVVYAVGRNEDVHVYTPLMDRTKEVLKNRKGSTQFRMSYNTTSGIIPSGYLKRYYELGQDVTTSPAFENEFIIVGAGTSMYSLRTDSNEIRWNLPVEGITLNSPSISNRKIYFSDSNGKLYCVHPDNKDYIYWSLKLDSPVHSVGLSISDEYIYVGGEDGNLYCVSSMGMVKWKFKTNGMIRTAPVSYKGIIYFGSDDGYFYAVDPSTGKELWKFKTGGKVQSTPSVSDNKIIFGSSDSKLYCLDVNNKGNKVWEFKTSGEVVSCPAIYEGNIIFGSKDKKIYSVDLNTGKKKWDFLTQGEITSSPTVVDDYVYVGSWDKNLYSLNVFDGQKKWSYLTEAEIKTTPIVINGVVYFGAGTRFYAIQ